MTDRPIATRLTPVLTSIEAQRAAAHRVELRSPLTVNTALHEEVWFELWPKKGKVSSNDAVNLANRQLTAAQFAHAMTDKRAGVLTAALQGTELSQETVSGLLEQRNAAASSAILLDKPGPWPYGPELLGKAARLAKGLHLLRELQVMDLDEAKGYITDWASWAPRWSHTRASLLSSLVERRPELLAVMAHSASIELVSTAAGSRHLRDVALQEVVLRSVDCQVADDDRLTSYKFAMLRLVNLPACAPSVLTEAVTLLSTFGDRFRDVVEAARNRLRDPLKGQVIEAYEDVTDPATIAWLLRRSSPGSNSYNSWTGKPLELEALGKNPNLSLEQATQIGNALSFEVVVAEMLDPSALCELLHERFGVKRWYEPRDVAPDTHLPIPTWASERMYDAPTVAESLVSMVLRSSAWATSAAEFLEEEVLDEQQWRTLLSVIDANPDMTFDDLLIVVRSVTPTV